MVSKIWEKIMRRKYKGGKPLLEILKKEQNEKGEQVASKTPFTDFRFYVFTLLLALYNHFYNFSKILDTT